LIDQLLNARNQPIDGSSTEILLEIDDEEVEVYPKTDVETEEYILNTIERRIRQNNTLVAARMVHKTSKNATVFQEGIVVTLAILVKLRLPTEAKRLLYRVIRRHKNSYSLSTKFGPLKGFAIAGQMNLVISPDPALLEDIRVD
jgi:hypothetical protein